MALTLRQLIKIAWCTINVSPLFANKWLYDETVLRLLLARYPTLRPSRSPPDGAGGAPGGGRGKRRGGRMSRLFLLRRRGGWQAEARGRRARRGPRQRPVTPPRPTGAADLTSGSSSWSPRLPGRPTPPGLRRRPARRARSGGGSTPTPPKGGGTTRTGRPRRGRRPELAAGPGRVPARGGNRPGHGGGGRRRGRRCGTSKRRQGGRRRRRGKEDEEEVEEVYERRVGHEVLLRWGDDHVDEAGGRAGVVPGCRSKYKQPGN